ncbi:DGQHR domain-containing protein [Exiguobacterium sp. R-39]|uniref:DGQHR domain-containing protein n=1 Tax=Exiguobacterium sp. R-39 TaxID=3416708 RepID=UPI003CE8C21D
MIINSYTKFTQNNKKFYLTKIKIHEILENYVVDVYQPDTEEGYQRPPISAHYKKFGKYILNNIDTFTLPQSILVAVSKEFINNDTEKLVISDKLRIVDGQHRIEGFKFLKSNFPSEYKKIENIEIPTTIMIVDNDTDRKKKQEIEAFINLNSKGKKVSTDLALNILDLITESKDNDLNIDDISEDSKRIFILKHIKEYSLNVSLRAAKKLNLDSNSLWYDGIIMTPGESYKIISINAFQKSLIQLCEDFMEKIFYEKGLIFDADSNDDKLTEEFKAFIENIWVINSRKWSDCFNLSEEYLSPKYNKKFNIQKGIGLFSLHIIAKESLNSSESISDAIKLYERTINDSKVVSNDWIIGGKFSTFNSQQGFSKLSKIIKNESIEADESK